MGQEAGTMPAAYFHSADRGKAWRDLSSGADYPIRSTLFFRDLGLGILHMHYLTFSLPLV